MKEFTFDLQRFDDKVWKSSKDTSGALLTLSDAIKKGGTITLQQPGGPGTFGTLKTRDITIDFSNYSYTLTNTNTLNANLTLTGNANSKLSSSTITVSDDRNSTLTLKGDLTLDSVTITDTGNGSVSSVETVTVTGNSNLTLTKGSFKDSSGTVYSITPKDNPLTFNMVSGSLSSISGVTASTGFSITQNGSTVEYSASGGRLQAQCNGKVKIALQTSMPPTNSTLNATDLDFDGENFTAVCFVDNGALTISNSNTAIAAMKSGDAIILIDKSNYSTIYGTLTYTNGVYSLSNTYKINDTDTEDTTASVNLSSITINDGKTVTFDKEFNNIPIIVSDSSNGSASFKSTAAGQSFTVQSNSSRVSVSGSSSITLTDGTILTSTAAQTITAGDYSVSGYSDTENKNNNNGIIVKISGSETLVGGIDKGESLKVGNDSYYRDDLGLRMMSGTEKATSDGIFADVSIDESYNNSYSADLSKLKSGIVSYITLDDSKVLTLGDTNTSSAVIVDKLPSANGETSTKLAQLLVESDSGNITYTLDTVTAGDASTFRSSVSTVSVMGGGSTNINFGLVGDNMTIVTKGGTGGKGAKFIVTNSADTFTVNGTTDYTTISGATAIKLLDGAITATQNQTITFGENGTKSLVIDSESAKITYNSTDTNKFKIGDTEYEITDIGLLSGGKYLLGSKTGEINYTDITDSTKWGELISIDTAISSTLGNAIIVDDIDNPTKLYADLTKDTDSVGYSLVKSSGGSALADNSVIKIDAATVSVASDFSSAGFSGIKSGAQFTITDDSVSDTFTIIDASDGASIDGITKITQTEGTLAPTTTQTVTAGSSSINLTADIGNLFVISVDSNATTLGGLDSTNDAFKVGNSSYTVYGVGLMDSSNKLLSSDKFSNAKVTLTDLATTTNWLDVLTATDNKITVSSTLGASGDTWIVVDADKTNRYGTLTNTENKYSLTKATSDSGTLSEIAVDGTTLTLSSGFANTSFSGIKSGAIFTVANVSTTFSITDDSQNDYAVIGGASNITLTAGKLAPDSTQSVKIGSNDAIKLSTDSGTKFVLNASDGVITGLDTNDVFYLGSASYTLLDNGRLQRTDGKIWNGDTISGSVSIADLTTETNWNDLSAITITGGALTIDGAAVTNLTNTDDKAFVVSSTDKKVIYGTLSKTSDGFSLSMDGQYNATLKAVTVTPQAQPVTFTQEFVTQAIPITAKDTTFKVSAADDTFTVNYSSEAVSVADATIVSLTSGTLTLTDPAQTVKALDNNIVAQSGTITAAVITNTVTVGSIDTTGDSVKIGERTYSLTDQTGNGITVEISNNTETVKNISTGDKFKIAESTNSAEFIKATGGFVKKIINSDNTESHYWWTKKDTDDKIIDVTTSGVDVETLMSTDKTGSIWTEIWDATDGVIEITTATPDYELTVVDVTNVTDNSEAVTYGTLSKTSGVYTLTQDSDDQTPTEIKLTGVKATFPATCSKKITAGDATFSVTTSNTTFTVDASDTYPVISDVTSINVTAGQVTAPLNIPVTVNSYSVVATKGTVTVGISGGKAVVGALNTGDTFTVDGITYEKTAAGLFDSKNSKIIPEVTDTYTLGDAAGNIIAVSGTTLDLTKQTTDALVYDSVKNPTTFLATLTAGTTLTLKGESTAATKIKTIKIAKDTAINVDFTTQITAPKGTATVNGQVFDGTGTLVIDTDGSGATLFSGTVTIAAGTPSATATNDKSSLEISNGSITATAAKGKFTKIASLDAGDSFTFDGKTYTQSSLGLMNDGAICESLAGTSIDVSKLSTADFDDIIAISDSVLDLTSQSADAIVFDDADLPTKKLATLTISGTNLTLKGNGTNAKDIKTITLATGANLTIDFATKIMAPRGTITVNDNSYNATTDIVLDTTAKTSTIFSGTITLDSTNPSATATSDKTSLAVESGTMTATAANGKFTTLTGLDSGESFTFGGNTYIQSSFGLINGKTICADLTGNTLALDKLTSAKWTGFIAPTNGVLDITDVKISSAVYDSATSPTTKLGDLTISGSTYTLDFPIQVKISGKVTVNGQSYNSSDEILLDTTATTSTLTSGTVNLSSGDSVTTTAGNSITANGGLTVTVKDSTITLGKLNSGDKFTVDGTEYSMTDAGLFKGDMIYTGTLDDSITVAQLKANDWSATVKISNDALAINSETVAGIVVSSDLNKIYGTLSKTADGFSLSDADSKLASIDVDGVQAEFAADFASVPITAGDSNFSAISLSNAKKSFTLDATGTAPAFTANVKALTLGEGNISSTANQTVTAGDNVITPVAGDMIIGVDSVEGLTSDAQFTLNDANYKLSAVGLLNTDDTKLVTAGFNDGTLTFADMAETLLIAPKNKVINLSDAKENSVVADNTTNPTKILGNVTVNNSAYTLDFAAQVKTSGNVTVNGQTYDASTEIILDTTATTSTLTDGTINLANGSSVTTTGGNSISNTGGDGLTVKADDGSATISGMTTGDSFTVDGENYTVKVVAPMNSSGKLWTGKDYSNGLTPSELADENNWSTVLEVTDATFAVNSRTLADGDKAVLVDDAENPTKTFGTLTKDGDKYSLDVTGDDSALEEITVEKTIIDVDSVLASAPINTINADNSESIFTVTPEKDAEFFTVDATGNTPTVDGVTDIELYKGNVEPSDGQTVTPAEGAEDAKVLLGNGTYTIGDKTFTIAGLKDGSGVEVGLDDEGNVKTLSGFDADSTLTVDGTTYTSPEDNSTLNYSDADGWFFNNYELDAYTVTVDRSGNISVDAGVKFTDVVNGARTLTSDGSIILAANVAENPVTVINKSNTNLKVSDADGSLINNLGKTSVIIQRADEEIILTLDSGEITLSAGNYRVNDILFTANGSAQVGTVDGGITFNLGASDSIIFDGTTLDGTGKVTIDTDGNLTVEGTIIIGDKTINAAQATTIIPTTNGLTVGETTLTVTGDTDGYQINIANGTITGLENIGSASGVTVGGLTNATVLTDKAGSFTVDRTFNSASGTTYSISGGKISGAETSSISGDFSGGLKVNVNTISATGGNVSVSGAGMISGADSSATIRAAQGISISDGTFAVLLSSDGFKIGDDTLTFANNTTPVTLGVESGKVTSVRGVNGTIGGLNDATVYGAGNATINGTAIQVSGSDCAALVMEGEVVGLVGAENGAIVSSAPAMTVKTGENGTFTFVADAYTINDTVDGTVDFITDANTKVTDIANFAGELSGMTGSVNVNGQSYGTTGNNVTVSTDGENITAVDGLQNGDSVGGELDTANITLPEGTVTINGVAYKLDGDDAANLNGKTITGLAADASLTVGESGMYNINGYNVTAQAGDVMTTNLDGAYIVDPTNPPITELTSSSEITSRGIELVEGVEATVGAGFGTVAVRHGAQAQIDVSAGGVIIPLSDAVTLENYNDNAQIQTYAYNDITGAVMNNDIKFGDGTMTLGDAIVVFNENASSTGATSAKLISATGDEQEVDFTHSGGGTINKSNSSNPLLMKGNYAAKSSDARKSGGSTLTSGSGDDTLLIGGGDVANAGAGTNQIYLTDSRLRDSAATIILGNSGRTAVHGFNTGFSSNSDVVRVNDLSSLEFNFFGSNMTMTSGNAIMTFSATSTSADLVESADIITGDSSYKLKLSDGNRIYKTSVAQDGNNIAVTETANLFYGNSSGITFSEYSGAVEVNLSNGRGTLDSETAQFYGINKLEGGKGTNKLSGAAGENNTLIAGAGDTSLWSANGSDIMTGNTAGRTTFYFLANDGQDTINAFDFSASSADASDFIDITTANEVTGVTMRNSDVVMQINNSANDYLTLVNAKGKDFRINNLIAKVDKNISYDGFTTCYVADSTNATMTVGQNMGNTNIWLGDTKSSIHGGIYYVGDIRTLDASDANGSNILAGNDLDNTILGGTGTNSIWGGKGGNDVMYGGTGKNTFFFALENGNDIVQAAHDGDIINLSLNLENISSTEINSGGVKIELSDGSTLDVQSNASIDYKLVDGSIYKADHNNREWIKK